MPMAEKMDETFVDREYKSSKNRLSSKTQETFNKYNYKYSFTYINYINNLTVLKLGVHIKRRHLNSIHMIIFSKRIVVNS